MQPNRVRRCSHDDLPMRRVLDAGSCAHLCSRAIRLSGDGPPALEVLSLRALALARAVGGYPAGHARSGRGRTGRVIVPSRDAFHFGGRGGAGDNDQVGEPRRAPGSQPRGRTLGAADEPAPGTILTKSFTATGDTVAAAS